MTVDSLNYHKMVRNALRGVVRTALKHVEEHGLPGVHHFYITYDTQYRGVSLSRELLDRYPEHIKIVIQNDYRDLVVDEDRFAVTLHFGGLPQRLVVPFKAILVFQDPTEQFVLHFEPDPELDGVEDEEEQVLDPDAPAGSLQLPVRAVLAAADRMQAAKDAQSDQEEADEPSETVAGESEPSEGDQALVPKAADVPDSRFGARSRAASKDKASTAKTSKAKASTAKTSKAKTSKAKTSTDKASKAETSTDKVAKAETSTDKVAKAETSTDKAAKDQATKDKAAKEKATKDKAAPKDNVVSFDAFRRK